MAFTIAVDGPAASGKGTISKRLAQELGFAHLDTGLIYRAVGKRVLTGQEPLAAAQTLQAEHLEDDSLRTPEVALAASKVAVLSEVRAALTDFQRAFSRRDGGAVLDGRDIGTVICPEAEVKLFVTASAEARAERRFKELAGKGIETTFEEVFADIRARDERDMGRAEAPLKPAPDAVHIDTTDMSIEDAFAAAMARVRARQESA
ncbi:MAG: (d)CMP kinase [Rhodobacteraceae bacterium]|nr:MAG: (d)CMP kinase [Paracoccaceae bacterium]